MNNLRGNLKALNKEERELKAYFDWYPLKQISKEEFEAVYPPREDYSFEPLEFKPTIEDGVIFGMGLSVYEMKDGCITVTQLKPEDALTEDEDETI